MYDVFLSFRGEDTRKNFTDHLFHALKQAGIRVFRDNDAIDRGRLLKPELDKGIKTSAVSVVVFSSSYASSRWCLDELLMILEERNSRSKHEVVPVFYDVDPTDIRHQTGRFGEAFNAAKLKAEDTRKVSAWRAALTEAANLTGMVLGDRHEADFIQEIVNEIKKKIRRDALSVEEYLVGMDAAVEQIESWMQKEGETNMLVLSGIGGIGKTTTAKRVYNLNFGKFEGSCFLAEIREAFNQPHTHKVVELQRQLVSNILRTQRAEEIISNVHEGASKVKEALVDREVLIVLDDVSDVKQLEVLFGTSKIHQGSKIIITSRDKGALLRKLEGHCDHFRIRGLDHNQSMKLFSWHAFGQDEPREDYREKAQAIVTRCGGLPLALKILGTSMRGRDTDVWEESIRKLEEIPDSDIHRKLKISYDSLDDNAKEVFLHVAHFFVGEDKDDVIKIVTECRLHPNFGLDDLVGGCLLDVVDNKLMMHQLLQEMGREIVRQESPQEPGERSRLWRFDDSFDVLKKKTGTKKIVGLSLQMRATLIKLQDDIEQSWYMKFLGRWNIANAIPSEGDVEIDSFERMDNLMLLRLDHTRLSGSYSMFPKHLIWLCLHGFPLRFLPMEMSLDKLVALDLSHSKLQKVWNRFKVLKSLKILNLSYSDALIQTPNFTGMLSLEKLILRGCASLVMICDSIILLRKLYLLDLQECQSLTNIPTLPACLLTLKLSNICAVGRGTWWDCLPQCLVNLDLKYCNLSSDSFPKEFGRLVSLKSMDVSMNPLTILPACVGTLPSLEILIVTDCHQLRSIDGLPATLQILDTRHNPSLEAAASPPDSLVDWKYVNSQKLSAIQGCFKSVVTSNVETKIIKHLLSGCADSSFSTTDLASVSRVDMHYGDGSQNPVSITDPIKVWYEFGIYSISLPREHLPSYYMFKTRGSQIGFKVPAFPTHPKVKGLHISFVCRSEITLPYHWTSLYVYVYNMTKDLWWVYSPSLASFRIFRKVDGRPCFLWLSLWKCGELLEEGDIVFVSIKIVLTALNEPNKNFNCDECSINLVYDDMMQEGNDPIPIKEEEVEICQQQKRAYELSWSEKMFVEISDFVNSGKRYYFSSYLSKISGGNDHVDGGVEVMDWLGPKSSSTTRHFHGGMVQFLQM